MGRNSAIEWTGSTWNPITGCTLVSEGCRNCYAAREAAGRLKNHPSRKGLAVRNAEGVAKFTGEVRFNAQWLDQPLRWTTPDLVFVCAHGDLFHESVPDEWIDRVFAVMAVAHWHTYQVLTKRPERMRAYFAETWQPAPARTIQFGGKTVDIPAEQRPADRWDQIDRAIDELTLENPVFDQDRFWTADGALMGRPAWPRQPLPNVWLGVSVEDQATADARIPVLLDTPAAIRWISAEPLLGDIDLTTLCTGHYFIDALRGVKYHDAERGALEDCPALDWAVAGGESGAHARPMHPDWARQLRNQCAVADVPFLFKQWGQYAPLETDADWEKHGADRAEHDRHLDANFANVGKKAAGRVLDGRTHDAWPEVST